ncbi:atherin-like [Empidonax traillii]|uniref:atherin-like n=1 Tax=Empidonax traillii TaxID=164674 RepID=UPI000FFD349F|nr:atherin-like [Empidonax traillii]
MATPAGPPRRGRLRGGLGPPPPSPPPGSPVAAAAGRERSGVCPRCQPAPSRPEPTGQRSGGATAPCAEGRRDGAAGHRRPGRPRQGAGSRLDVPAAAAAVHRAPEPAGQPRQRGEFTGLTYSNGGSRMDSLPKKWGSGTLLC